jgi:hypothetical protein
MIHYHGIAGGMKREQAARFLKGRHAFISFAQPEDLPVAAEVCQSFAFDNGAFSIWQRGEGQIDYEAYVAWVRDWSRHPGFDFAVIPDIIDGTPEENDDWVRRWPGDLWGVPVWHIDDPISRLPRLCGQFHTVAIGSSGENHSPGSEIWWDRMRHAMDAACDADGRPLANLHGLRLLDPTVFSHLPLASADSINANRRANSADRFGSYPPPSQSQRSEVVAERIEAHNSLPRWPRSGQQRLFANGADRNGPLDTPDKTR